MKNEVINYLNTALVWFLTAVQVDEILKYINLGLSILMTLLSLLYSFYNIYKKMKEKGELDKDEIKEAQSDIEKIKEEIEDYLKSTQKGEKRK